MAGEFLPNHSVELSLGAGSYGLIVHRKLTVASITLVHHTATMNGSTDTWHGVVLTIGKSSRAFVDRSALTRNFGESAEQSADPER